MNALITFVWAHHHTTTPLVLLYHGPPPTGQALDTPLTQLPSSYLHVAQHLSTFKISMAKSEKNPMLSLLFYSIAMVSLPIAAYFTSKSILDTLTDKQSANIYSAIAAVIVVHVILFFFVYIAYSEDKQLSKPDKLDNKTD